MIQKFFIYGKNVFLRNTVENALCVTIRYYFAIWHGIYAIHIKINLIGFRKYLCNLLKYNAEYNFLSTL